MEKQVVIIAFNKDMIKAVRKADPGLSVNFLTSAISHNEDMAADVARQIIDNVSPLNTAYSPSKSAGVLGKNLYRELGYRGITVWNWTVNNESEFNQYFISGIRGITTNYPQWAGKYIEDLDVKVNADATLTVSATQYNGTVTHPNGKIVCVEGKVVRDSKTGVIALDGCEEAYFFVELTKTTSTGQSYTVVSPLVYFDGSVSENNETTATDTTAPRPDGSIPDGTEPDTGKGCASAVGGIALIALVGCSAIIRRRED